MSEQLSHPVEQLGTDEGRSREGRVIHVRPGHNESRGFDEVDSLRSNNSYKGCGRRSWVLIDRAWAKQLGVTRTGGTYRISRRELMRKLDELQPATLPRPGILTQCATPSASTDKVLELPDRSGWSISWTSRAQTG